MNRVASDMNTWRNREERFEKLFPEMLIHFERIRIKNPLGHIAKIKQRCLLLSKLK